MKPQKLAREKIQEMPLLFPTSRSLGQNRQSRAGLGLGDN